MSNPLCILMGGMDIVAGATLAFTLEGPFVFFGILMIGKGAMSFF